MEEKKMEQEVTLFDAKAIDEAIRAKVKEAGGVQEFYRTNDFIKGLLKSAFQSLLDVEMEEHVGYAKHAAEGRGNGNSRNGTNTKTVRGEFGEIEIETP